MAGRLVITGMGAVTPIGIGVDAYWENLLAGKCGIGKVEGLDIKVDIAASCTEFNPENYMSKRKAAEMSRFIQMGYAAAKEAVEMSGLPKDSARTGLTVGTALDGLANITQTQKKYDASDRRRTDPRFLTKSLGNLAACHVSIEYGFTGPSLCINTACASGGDAILTAALLLKSGMADAMVVIGAEAPIDEVLMQSLIATKAISPTGSRPFDRTRDGFVPGEGAGALVIETLEHAQERNAEIICELCGWANNSDGYTAVAPRPDGAGEKKCMRDALAVAGIEPEQIGYVNAHGTATPKGDEVEAESIAEVFGKTPYVGSSKGSTGHMMGAGGITEVITCVKAIETGIIPPTAGLSEPGTDEVRLAADKTEADIAYAISNAFGFGGQNSSIIVGRFLR